MVKQTNTARKGGIFVSAEAEVGFTLRDRLDSPIARRTIRIAPTPSRTPSVSESFLNGVMLGSNPRKIK